MIDVFGRMPVRTRGYVRHIIGIPGGGSAYNSVDNILITGDGARPTLFLHEAAHSVDFNAFRSSGTPAEQRFSCTVSFPHRSNYYLNFPVLFPQDNRLLMKVSKQ